MFSKESVQKALSNVSRNEHFLMFKKGLIIILIHSGFPPPGKIRESQGEIYFVGRSGKGREFILFFFKN